jgi:hypothetical protein
MPEILTESFCERCGTRYTFESVAPRKTRRLGQFKTLSKGVRNWEMSDHTSLDEALAAARSDEEREVTAQQLDAFHSTFNFCMNCRQYTCANCWNPVEGRCLSCAPNLGQEVLGAAFPSAAGFEPVRMDAEAWPEVDLAGGGPAGAAALDVAGLPAETGGNGFHVDDLAAASDGPVDEPLPEIDATARLAFLAGSTDGDAEPESGPVPSVDSPDAEAAPDLAWPDETSVEPALTATTEVEVAGAVADADTAASLESAAGSPEADAAVSEPADEDTDQRAAELASRTSALFGRFRPGQSLDAEIAAYEARLEAEEAQLAIEAEPVAAAAELDRQPEPVVAPEPVDQPIAAEPVDQPMAAEPVDQPIAAEPDLEPVAATSEPPAPPASRDDVVEQPTWRIFAPDPNAVSQPGVPGTTAPAGTPIQASGDPQWPARPELEDSPSMALFANRDRVSSDALWAASAREVLGGPVGPTPAPTAGIQPCSNCGLSLSANARFCRRCGTRQG